MVDRLLNVQETAKLLGISIHTVYAWVSQERLPFVKLGRRTMFEPAGLQRWLVKQRRREK